MPFSYISTEKLVNGESVALGTIEIKAIPHISIIDEKNSIDEVLEKYKNDMLLN